jgi:TonB-linked SusC/RagA family outer membrane protein
MKEKLLFNKISVERIRRHTGRILQLLFIVTLLCSTSVFGQKARVVTGKVVDGNNVALPGASVVVANTSVGTITNGDGSYSINVAGIADEQLVVSYIGFLTKTVPVDNQSIVNITLEEDLAILEQVVVVGYGTQKKLSLTAAVSVIDNEEIQTTTNVSIAQKLSGKIAGVQIRQQSGQPGAFDNDINIRGFGAPIYVIDGIRRGGSRDFQQLNAEDIESITVLKDAAAAIYGLGAGNGVILVTTKKGGNSKPSFNYSVVQSSVRPTDVPQMASAGQYVEMWNDTQLFIPGGAGVPYFSAEEVNKWKTGAPGYEGTDWGDLVLKKQASTVQHNVSATGGSEKMNYFVSFGYTKEDGLLKSEDMGYERFNIRSNLTTEFTKNLTGSILLSGRWDKNFQPGANFFNIFKGTRTTLPTEPAFANGNPDFLAPVSSGLNPVAFMERDITGYSTNDTKNFTSTFSLDYDAPFIEGLSLRAVAAYDIVNFQNKSLTPTYNLYTYNSEADAYDPQKQNDGTANISNANTNSYGLTLQGFINYNRVFNNDHTVGATAVIEKNTFDERRSDLRRYYASFYTKDQLRFADVLGQQSDGIETASADFSYVGRVNYAYKDKYLVEFAGRYMGSYRYAPESRYGFYPTASLGWRISEENFIRDNLNWVSNLKLRASYGVAGMPEGSPFQYVLGYSIGSGGSYEFMDGTLTEGITTPPPPNGNLSWMEATIKDIGVDMGFLSNRLTLTTDVYERLLDGIPAKRSIALPNTYGGELPQENLNSEITRGIEFTVGYRDNIGQDLTFNLSTNFSLARTRRRHVEGESFTNSYDQWRNQQSDRWNDIAWGYNYIGQFQNVDELRNAPMQNGDQSNVVRELPGDFRYEDWNGDGIIDGQDEQPLFFGGRPKMFYGLNLSVQYKGFYSNLILQGAANYTVRFREVYAEMFAFRGNTPVYFYDRWQKADPYNIDSEWVPGKWPANRTIGSVGGMYKESSVWRRDASYLRIKTLEFGYNVKSDYLSRTLGVRNMRVYASGFNLYTFADAFVKPFDPEKIEGAYSAGFTYPVTKTYNVGLNVNF